MATRTATVPIPAQLALARLRRLSIGVSTDRVALLILAVGVGTLALVPLGFLVLKSFTPVEPGNLGEISFSRWTLANFTRAYSDPQSIAMLGNSFMFAGGSMAVSLLFGGTLAFLVERTNTPLRNVIYAFMFIPLAMPGMLKAIGWILLISPRIGVLNQIGRALGIQEPVFNAYSLPAMFWVEGLSMAPLTFLMLGVSLRMMDPSLEEAAHMSGASSLQTTFRITLRLMWPALAGIALLQFVRGIEAFEIPLIMGSGQGIVVFSTNIYIALRESYPPDYGKGFAYSMTLLTIALVGVILYQKSIGKYEKYTTVSGKAFRPRLIQLGKWRVVAFLIVLCFVLVSVVAPLLVLVWASLLKVYQPPSLQALERASLDNYTFLFRQAAFAQAGWNSALLSGTVALSCMALAVAVSLIVVRLRTRGSTFFDYVIFLTYAVPSVAVGLSFLVLFLSFPNPIYGTLWIMVLPYVVIFLPIATRFTHAGMAQLSKELEEAASMSGARFWSVMRRVTVPLLLPSLVGGGLYILLLSVKVASVAMLLYNPDTIILPVWIYRLWDEGSVGQTSALSVLMISALIIVIAAGRRLIQHRSAVD